MGRCPMGCRCQACGGRFRYGRPDGRPILLGSTMIEPVRSAPGVYLASGTPEQTNRAVVWVGIIGVLGAAALGWAVVRYGI